MTLDDYAMLAEILGAILIIVTLVFLLLQIRQSTKATRAATSQAIHEHMSEIYGMVVGNKEFSAVFVNGMRDPDSLSPSDTAQFFAFWMSACIAMQNLRAQTEDRVIPPDLLEAYSNNIINMSSAAGFQAFWTQRKHLFSPDFRNYMENEVFGKDPTEGYRAYYEDKEST